MNTPEFAPPSCPARKMESVREDSGYVSITPNVSECTDASSCVSLGRPYRLLERFESSRTDCPKMDTDQGLTFLDNSPGLLSSTRFFPSSTVKNLSFADEPSSSRRSNRSNSLRRQSAVDMEWSPVERRLNFESTPLGKDLYSIVETLDRITPIDGELSNAENTRASPIVKGSEKMIRDSIHKTPKKHGIKRNSITKHRPVKKTYPVQRIGTPEKNRLLYSQLKRVTPAKAGCSQDRIRLTPEKEKSPGKSMREFPKKDRDYCGVEKVDFVRLLADGVLEQILGHLTDSDLINASRVCQLWRSRCMEIAKVRRRLSKIEQKLKENKENVSFDVTTTTEYKKGTFRKNRSVELVDLEKIQNILSEQKSVQHSPPGSPRNRKFRLYMKAASQETVNQLRSCTRCQKPARLKDKWATCTACDFTFCILCHNEKKFCQSSSCPNAIKAASPSKDSPVKTATSIKKSKRNLRRLLF